MKTSLLVPTCALLGISAFAADPEPKPETNPPAKVPGKATVTIDINGRKETRSFDLDKATLIKIDDKVAASAVAAKTSPASVLRTWLGVITEEPSEDVRAQISVPDGTGLLVRGVMADSPAAKAGLDKNDLLIRMDDQILINPDQLRKLISTKKEGDVVHLTYLRKGREASVEARLGSHVEDDASGAFVLGRVISKGLVGEIRDTLKPLVLESTLAFDTDGNLAWSNWSDLSKARAKLNETWGYFFNPQGQPNLEEATKELEKALRSVGTKEEVISQIKKSLDDAAQPLRQWATDMKGRKFDTQLTLQSAAEDIRRSVEQVWRAEVEAALRSIPDEPAKKDKPQPSAPAPEKAP